MTLEERRALLRQVAASRDKDDYSLIAAAVDGASESQRASLARTLPAAQLFQAEGLTPRACFALAALGTPHQAAWTVQDTHRGFLRSAPVEAAGQVMALAAAGRDRDWAEGFVGQADELSWGRPLAQPAVESLNALHGLYATNRTCLLRLIYRTMAATPEEIVANLRRDPLMLSEQFWCVFRLEGAGLGGLVHDDHRGVGAVWQAAMVELMATEPGFRDRLLDESLRALLRDFSAYDVGWYHRVHRLAQPTPEEIAARQSLYLSVLGTAPSMAVGFAQDMAKRALPLIDADALIAASAAVLGRPEKKLVKAQLGLLSKVEADESQRRAISDLVAGVMETLPPELGPAARLLLMPGAEPAPAAVVAGDPVVVPPPRRQPLTRDWPERAPIRDREEFRDLAAAQLEDVGDGAELPRILEYCHEHGPAAVDPALAKRAMKILEQPWGFADSAPRLHLADLLAPPSPPEPAADPSWRQWLTWRRDRRAQPSQAAESRDRAERRVAFGGWRRDKRIWPGQPDPPGARIQTRTVTGSHRQPDGSRVDVTEVERTAWWMLGLNAPATLLAEQFKGPVVTVPLERVNRRWRRAVLPPGTGAYSSLDYVLGEEPKPFWLAVDSPTGPTGWAARVLDVSQVPDEFSFRAAEARNEFGSRSGCEQIMEWLAWMLRDNPDTLAAHAHPALLVATRVVNSCGVSPVLRALGSTREMPTGPAYSALALGLTAKMPQHRAGAAEAVAALAESGLLDPEPFAVELAAHLTEGFAMPSRIGPALADVASISGIAGYRVLETLAALLGPVAGLSQAGKLVQVAARLADAYGTPIPIPEALAKRRKGGSVLATALRALEAVTPRPTALAEEAARQAEAARNQ
ncbi:MAG: DUF6493 family protein [Bifidobacteriaceae bacterium]|jgi:hypothetical protein|nr:DUF6493 family protein [Bifidobacteriaceae bacterium]